MKIMKIRKFLLLILEIALILTNYINIIYFLKLLSFIIKSLYNKIIYIIVRLDR